MGNLREIRKFYNLEGKIENFQEGRERETWKVRRARWILRKEKV